MLVDQQARISRQFTSGDLREQTPLTASFHTNLLFTNIFRNCSKMTSSDEEKEERSRLQRKKPEGFEALVVEPRESTPPPYSRPETPPRGPSRRRRTGNHRPAPVESPRKESGCPWSDENAFKTPPPGQKSQPSTPKGRPRTTRPKPSPQSPPKKRVKGSQGLRTPKTVSKQSGCPWSDEEAFKTPPPGRESKTSTPKGRPKTASKKSDVATTPLESTYPPSTKKKRGYTIKRRHLVYTPSKRNSSRRDEDTAEEQISSHEVDFVENNDCSGNEDFVGRPTTAISYQPELSTTDHPLSTPSDPPSDELQPSTSRACRRRQANENEVDFHATNATQTSSTTHNPQSDTVEPPKRITRKKSFPPLRQRPPDEKPPLDDSSAEDEIPVKRHLNRRPGELRIYSSDEESRPVSPSRVSGRPTGQLSSDEEVVPTDDEYEDVQEVDFKDDSSENHQPMLRRSSRTRPVNLRIESSSSSESDYDGEDINDSSSSNYLPSENEDRDEVDFDEDLSESDEDNVTESYPSNNNTDSNDDSEDVDIEEELSDNDRPNRIPIPSTKGFQVDMSNIPHQYSVLLKLGKVPKRLSGDRDEELKIITKRFIDNRIEIDPNRVCWKRINAYRGRPEREEYVLKYGKNHQTMESYVHRKLKELQSGAGALREASKTQEKRKEHNCRRRKQYKENSKIKENIALRKQENLQFVFYQLILTKQDDVMELGNEELLQRLRDDPLLEVSVYTGEWTCPNPTLSYRLTHKHQIPTSLCRELVHSGYRCLQSHIQIFQSKAESAIFETYVMFNENKYAETNASYSILNKVLGVRIHTSLVMKAIELGRQGIKLTRNDPTQQTLDVENEDPFDLGYQINAVNFQDITERIRGRPLQPVIPRPQKKPVEFLVYVAFGFKQSDVSYSSTNELKSKLRNNPKTPFYVYAGTWSRLQGEKNNGVNRYHFHKPDSALYKFVKEGGIVYAGTQFVCGSLEEALKLEARLIMKTFAYADHNPFCHCLNTKYGDVILSSQQYLDAILEGSTAERVFVIGGNNNQDSTTFPLSTNFVDITNLFGIN